MNKQMEIYYKPEKNMHNAGNSPNFHSKLAMDVLGCPLCMERVAQSDDMSAEFLINEKAELTRDERK